MKKHYIRPYVEFEDLDPDAICDGITGSAHGQKGDSGWGGKNAKRASFYDFEDEDSVVNDPFADPLVINEEFEYSLNIPY